jgi:hypothetical protein
MNNIKKEKSLTVSCYSYTVSMDVQVFAENEEQATATLNSSGGYVSRKDIILKNTISIPDKN